MSEQAFGDGTSLSPCTKEEAESRIFLQVAASTSCGHKSTIVRTSNNDVVVFAVSAFVSLSQESGELWIAFDMQPLYRNIQIDDIIRDLRHTKSTVLPAFHALAGYDTTSSFYRKEKRGMNCMKVTSRTDCHTSTPLSSRPKR